MHVTLQSLPRAADPAARFWVIIPTHAWCCRQRHMDQAYLEPSLGVRDRQRALAEHCQFPGLNRASPVLAMV